MNSKIEITKTGKSRQSLTAQKDGLHQHPLLQVADCNNVASLPVPGSLVWVRTAGSAYWPALVSQFTEEVINLDGFDAAQNTLVVFLEGRFRVSTVQWNQVIAVNVPQIEEQEALVSQLNKVISRKPLNKNRALKQAISLFWEFHKLDPSIRVITTEDRFKRKQDCRTTNKGADMSQEKKQNGTLSLPTEKELRSPNLLKNSSMHKAKMLALKKEPKLLKNSSMHKAKMLALKKALKIRRQSNSRYSFRSAPSPANKPSPTPVLASKKLKDADNTSKVDINNNVNGTNVTVPVVMKNKKTGRPLQGGERLKEWTKEQFSKIDKKFAIESGAVNHCTSCKTKIEDEHTMYCHDFPFHKKCLKEGISAPDKEGVTKVAFKCIDCIEKRCYVCKVADNTVAKCCKCPLRYHRDCLKQWPQAVIQGMTGPITCPLHFCHTCKAEERCLNKLRNCKLSNNKAYRCIQCLSAYHKAGCLPAGCGATITGNAFIECPKHFDKEPSWKKIKRLGCFGCNKKLVEKEEHVECKHCYMIFHPACTGYTEEEIKDGITLSDFSANFQCNTCCWGLFPLYGQVVWYQQPGSCFWPARILYPKESAVRNKEKKGYYSVVYCGTQAAYYDSVPQSVPFHITGIDFLTKLNIYNEKPPVLTSYEEAGYTLTDSEAYRDSLLVKPEPYYKKIDKNYYKTSMGLGKRIDITKTSPKPIAQKSGDAIVCQCGTLNEPNPCGPNVGCYNRDSSLECHPDICSAPDKCKNRMFSVPSKTDEMLEYFSTGKKGWGVKATRKIASGEFIIEYLGEVITRVEMGWRASKKNEEDPLYILDLGSNLYIDAEFLGNVSRLINHSCDPNCITEKYNSLNRPVVGVFAARDIEPGEELTFNYGYGKSSAAPFQCHCSAKGCQGYIGRKIVENEENLKPLKRKRCITEEFTKTEADDEWNNNCEVCTFGGHVILCDYNDCRKVFHLKCVGLKKAPRGIWVCPTHPTQPEKKRKKESKKTLVPVPSPSNSTSSFEVAAVENNCEDANTPIKLVSRPVGRPSLAKRRQKAKQEKAPSSRNRTLKSLNTSIPLKSEV